MATTSQEMTVFSCDAVKCDGFKTSVTGALPPKYHTGTVQLGADDTDGSATWIACRDSHVGRAALAIKAASRPQGVSEGEDAEDSEDSEELQKESETFDDEAAEFASR
jgi:hypothetical protein